MFRHVIFYNKEGVTLKGVFDSNLNPEKNKECCGNTHTWLRSNQSAYMVTTANKLLKNGYDVLRLNLRDHGETQHLNKEIFNSTMMPEVADCLQLFLDERNYSK